MEATELVMQCARANQKKATQTKANIVLSNMEIWNNTHQECARPTQTQMGMSGQTPGRCRTPRCNDPNARISAKSKGHSNLSLVEGIGNNIEKSYSKVQAQIRSC